MDVVAGTINKIHFQAYNLTTRPTDDNHTDNVSVGYWEHTGDHTPAPEWGAHGDAPDLSRTHITSEVMPSGSVHLTIADDDSTRGMKLHFERDDSGMGALVVNNPGPGPMSDLIPAALVQNKLLVDLGDIYNTDAAWFNHELTPPGMTVTSVDVTRQGSMTTISLAGDSGDSVLEYYICGGSIRMA